MTGVFEGMENSGRNSLWPHAVAVLVCGPRQVDEATLLTAVGDRDVVVVSQAPEVTDAVIKRLILHYRLSAIRDWFVVDTHSSTRELATARRRLGRTVGQLRDHPLVSKLIRVQGYLLDVDGGTLGAQQIFAVAS